MKRTINLKKISLLYFAFFILYNSFSKPSYIEKMKASGQLDSHPLKGFFFRDNQSHPECHTSTILHLKNEDFIASWIGGTKEKNDDAGIGMPKGKPVAWCKTLGWAYNSTTRDRVSTGKPAPAISFDHGKPSPKKIGLKDGKQDKEFSYPPILNLNDPIALTYTFHQKKIAYRMTAKDRMGEEGATYGSYPC